MWDIGGEGIDSVGGSSILEVANFTLNELTTEVVLFEDDRDNNEVMNLLQLQKRPLVIFCVLDRKLL